MALKNNFILEFFRQRKTVGAMAPSSRFLRAKMLRNINFKRDQIFIELGPGTGVFTHEIIKRMSEHSQLFVFEINDNFYDNLVKEINDSRVHLIHDSAAKMQEYLAKKDLTEADIIISSLPFAVFDEKLRDTILLTSYSTLKKHGKYIQFQYTLQLRKQLSSIYQKVRINFTAFNIPPAFVYTCTKK